METRKIESRKQFLINHCNFIKHTNKKNISKNKELSNITNLLIYKYNRVSILTTRDIFKKVFNN